MLKRFEVTNFKNFKEKFVFDLSNTKDFQFNTEAVQNGIVKTGLIYGANGCGKSNLGLAIMDIRNHISDEKIPQDYLNKYTYSNADTDSGLVEFTYIFQSGEYIVEYRYGKVAANELVYEEVIVDGKQVLYIDRRKANDALIKLEGTETLQAHLPSSNISIVKYVVNNSTPKTTKENILFNNFYILIQSLKSFASVDTPHSFRSFQGNNYYEMIVDENSEYSLKRFEYFLNDAGVNCTLTTIDGHDGPRIAFVFATRSLDLLENASSGTLALCSLYAELRYIEEEVENVRRHSIDLLEKFKIQDGAMLYSPIIFCDEFDAFYHHSLSKLVVKTFRDLDAQVILTTHNTSIMTNDLLRPDTCFVMDSETISPLHERTIKDLRKAHSLEKMYRAGAFDE